MSSKQGHTERIGRRTYLAGLGATVLGASATTTAAASAYDTVTVEREPATSTRSMRAKPSRTRCSTSPHPARA
ncbi:hypothetical protein D8S78_16025 [Natrialba swarupiae]|nr:hypothetical protein [Natrialba swarupiae]